MMNAETLSTVDLVQTEAAIAEASTAPTPRVHPIARIIEYFLGMNVEALGLSLGAIVGGIIAFIVGWIPFVC